MAAFLSILLVFFCCVTSASAGKAALCSVTGYGDVTLFNGDREKVELPCKYRLADFTCGGYHIKVTPGSALDGKRDNRFSPDTVWVSITKVTNGRYWIGRTSAHLLRLANTDSEVWVEKEGDLYIEVEGYEANSQSAVLERRGVFRISFSIGGDDDGVKVKCASPSRDFKPGAYPTSLCGDPGGREILKTRRQQLFGDSGKGSHSLAVLHDVLNNDVITQSEICQGIAADFRACGSDTQRAKIARVCGPIFAARRLAFCLLDDVAELTHFNNCMTSICHNDVKSCRVLKKTVDRLCPELAWSLAELDC